MGDGLERVDKGLKRLKEAMDAKDIKRVRVHRRAGRRSLKKGSQRCAGGRSPRLKSRHRAGKTQPG